jgi:hypothetical protein
MHFVRNWPLADVPSRFERVLPAAEWAGQAVPSGGRFRFHCLTFGIRGHDIGILTLVDDRGSPPYRSGPCKSWIKVRNPKSPAYMRIIDRTF